MKRILSLILLVALVLSLVACDFNHYLPDESAGTMIAAYPKDAYPVKMVKTSTHWVAMLSYYGSADYELAIGTTLDVLESVYTTQDVSIWFMDANEEYVVWCEKSEENYTYKAHSIEEQTTEVVFQTTTDVEMQLMNVDIHNNGVYYAYMDFEAQQAHIHRYDLQTKAVETVYSPAWEGSKSVMCFAIEAGLLSVAAPTGVTVLNLDTGKTVFENALPEDTYYVFSVSYDAANSTCALYYRDSDSEDIGTMQQGDAAIRSVYTFGSNEYAYQDQIKCVNGCIFWISQHNVSGNVTDHYRLIQYDYLQDKPTETNRTIAYFVDGKTVYFLRFDKGGDYQNVELRQR